MTLLWVLHAAEAHQRLQVVLSGLQLPTGPLPVASLHLSISGWTHICTGVLGWRQRILTHTHTRRLSADLGMRGGVVSLCGGMVSLPPLPAG